MRISTSLIYQQGLRNILEQQSRVADTQNQIGSGLKNSKPSDDPSASARIIDLNEAIAKLAQFNDNTTFAQQRLGTEESVLQSAGLVVQRTRELALQAGNTATQTTQTREAIAAELEQRLDELLALANTRDANGDYLFSGFQSNAQAFTRDAAGNYIYNGDQGHIEIQVGESRNVVVNDSGAEVFQQIRQGNGSYSVDAAVANTGNGIISIGSVIDQAAYQVLGLGQDFTITFAAGVPPTFTVANTSGGAVVPPLVAVPYQAGAAIAFNGLEISIDRSPLAGDVFNVSASRNQDIFTSIQDLIDDLRTQPSTPAGTAQLQHGVNSYISNADRTLDRFIDTRTRVGGRLNAIDSQAQTNANQLLQLETVRSQLRDLDYTVAISNLNLQLVALQAAQQSFVRVQNLSLFNFI